MVRALPRFAPISCPSTRLCPVGISLSLPPSFFSPLPLSLSLSLASRLVYLISVQLKQVPIRNFVSFLMSAKGATTLSITALRITTLGLTMKMRHSAQQQLSLECCYAVCRSAECRSAECRSAEGRGALQRGGRSCQKGGRNLSWSGPKEKPLFFDCTATLDAAFTRAFCDVEISILIYTFEAASVNVGRVLLKFNIIA